MNKTIVTDIEINFDIPALIKRLRIPDFEHDNFKALIKEVTDLAKPKFVYKELFITQKQEDTVTIEETTFKSKVMYDNLKEANKVYAYVCTCGTEISEYAKAETDFLKVYWLDELMLVLLGMTQKAFHAHIEKKYDLHKMANMNPGSLPDWPLSNQEGLFHLIGDVEKNIGVKLEKSMLMTPAKSTSGLRFVNDNDYANCELCKNLSCPSRRKDFDQEKFDKIFK